RNTSSINKKFQTIIKLIQQKVRKESNVIKPFRFRFRRDILKSIRITSRDRQQQQSRQILSGNQTFPSQSQFRQRERNISQLLPFGLQVDLLGQSVCS